MNLQELRIGNWIYISNEEGIKFPHLVNLEYFKSDYHGNESPIPLTPDILEKVGFKGEDHGNVTFIHYYIPTIYEFCEIFELAAKRNDFEKYEYGKFYFSLCEFEMEIQYVHQLQNLYFALTGKELEINL